MVQTFRRRRDPRIRSLYLPWLAGALAAGLLMACGDDGGAGAADTEQTEADAAATPEQAGAADEAVLGTIEEIEQLEGEEREAALLECATEEEPLLWYTTLIEDQLARPLAEAFEERYPGLTVEISRSNSSGVIEKMVTEARAGRIESDVWSASQVQPLKEADLIQPYSFPTAANYPDDLKDAAGTWVASNVYVFSPGYNTQAVPADAVPETYEDLLDPRWKGRMAWSTSSTSGWTGFVGHVLETMGEEEGMAYLEQLGQQDIAALDVSARQVVDQVIAGEYDIGLQIFNHHTIISADVGAPVDWIPMEPLMVSSNPTGITKGASSPCAARLFTDYQLSLEGQELFREADYLPAHPDVSAKEEALIPEDTGLEYQVMGPEYFDEHEDEWNEVIDQFFR